MKNAKEQFKHLAASKIPLFDNDANVTLCINYYCCIITKATIQIIGKGKFSAENNFKFHA